MNRSTARLSAIRRSWSNFKAVVPKFWNYIVHCNPPAFICSHLISKNHSHGHRLFVGVLIMALGVLIAKHGGGLVDTVLPHSFARIGHYFFDLIGYLGHGVGAMPWLESLERFRSND